ncbi:hypothetical protein POM88_019761 [Heracleum sosnowskyi]|uniref:Replication protein A 70 kDa DNA-binding subunit B/D first OB fold domain-containing protein n=1 Tax=Heracleum sosnowskyi TaxID=360622 RepID=A0AAD8IAJ2_9APIA|nr:hypothetical protein POM88_019761 [Heracleum sosnowskyi]
MDLNNYDTIQSLDTSTFNWKCRLRARAVWKAMKNKTKEFWGLNILFIDDSNGRIHAFANAKYCEDLLKSIVEGEIYIISNFKVKDFLGDETYRPVRNQKHIYFTQNTKVLKDEIDGLTIEKYAFDIFHMADVEKAVNDNRFLIDFVGKVQNLQPKITTTKNNQEKVLLKFDISDGRNRVKVTFFDEFGEQVEEKLKKVQDEDIFIIISCAKVGRYDGLPNLTNYPATRIYINPDHYSLDDMRKKSHVDNVDIVEEIPKKLMDVKEIKKLPAIFIDTQIDCQVKVKKIEEKSTWFRVGTLCSDKTGSLKIIFGDAEITRLIDTTVFDIHAECLHEAAEEEFPPVLKQFLNQEYTITLDIKKQNVENGSTVFEAVRILPKGDMSESCNTNKESMNLNENGSLRQESEVEGNMTQTPQTANSSNKTRGRKLENAILFYDNDDSPQPKFKNIKVEKVSTKN